MQLPQGERVANWFGRVFLDAYNLPAEYTNIIEKVGIDISSKEQEFMRIAVTLAEQSPSVKRIVYEFLDGRRQSLDHLVDPTGKTHISKEVHQLSLDAQKLIRDLGQDMVDAGLITKKVWEQNKNAYIHRTYIAKELKSFSGDIAEKDFIKAKENLGVIGVTSMDRGHRFVVRETDFNKIKEIEGKGFVRAHSYIHGKKKIKYLVYRKPLSLMQRRKLGEVEDAAFAIASTGKLMLNDYSVYKIYNGINEKFGLSLEDFQRLSPVDRDTYRLVKQEFVKNTDNQLEKFGNLTDRYIPKDIYDDLITQRYFKDLMVDHKALGTVFKTYRNLNRKWKRVVTTWNPTVHVNNTMSNFVLLDLHDVPVTNLFKYGRKIWTEAGQKSLNSDFADLGPIYDDLIRFNVFDAGLLKGELGMSRKDFIKTYADEFLNLKIGDNHSSAIEASTNIAGKIWETLGKKVGGLDRLQGQIYQNEDSMFRVAHYVHNLQQRVIKLQKQGLKKGTTEYKEAFEMAKGEAAKAAKKGFIDYNITAPGVQVLRETAVPFIAYAWRIIPILAEAATKKPHKFMKWATIGYALNYAGNENSGRDEKYERHLMEKEKMSRLFGIPFIMPYTYLKVPNLFSSVENVVNKRLDAELDFNINDERSIYWNVRRWIPGGDTLGHPEVGDGWLPGLPAPLQPSFGLLGALAAPILFNRDPFTMEPIDRSKTTDEFASWWTQMVDRRIVPALTRLVPNNPLFGSYGIGQLPIPGTDEYIRLDAFNSWSHKKILNSLEQRRHSSITRPDIPVWMAIAQSFSVKLWPWDENIEKNLFSIRTRGAINKRLSEITRIWDNLYYKYKDTDVFPEKRREAERQIKQIYNQMDEIVLEQQRERFLARRRPPGKR